MQTFKKKLLKQIIELEYEMFQQVITNNQKCKDRPETFKITREARFYPLSAETLSSYLGDLQQAKKEGRNLLMEKYARMDNLIPPMNSNPLIEKIVEIEGKWIEKLSVKYPRIFSSKPESFKSYLSCELETFSDRTLELYFKDVSKAKGEGKNLAEESYVYLFQKIGYSSIEELEGKLKEKFDTGKN